MYHARFPCVTMQDGEPVRVIKPLFLAQDDPERIFTHGHLWIRKIQRLRGRKLLPDAVLLPLEAPLEDDAKRHGAFEEIAKELAGLDVAIVNAQETDRILQFARG